MTYVVQNNEKTEAWFDVKDGQPYLELDDANYARAEKVLYIVATHSVHAVMYDGLFLLGEVPEHFRNGFSSAHKVVLKSVLPDGGVVRMVSDLVSVQGYAQLETKKEEVFDLLPIFAAAGNAVCDGVV